MTARVFLLPDLGEGLTEAEIVQWLVAEGEVVSVDQSVVEVDTAKSLVEVPTPYAGRVAKLHAAEGTTLDVGKPLITVAALNPEAEETSRPVPPSAGGSYREEERAGSGNVLIGYGTSDGVVTTKRRRRRDNSQQARIDPPAGPERVPRVVSPLVRRLAREADLDLRTVEPSAPGGVIRKVDVQRALAVATAAVVAPGAGSPDGRRIPLNGFRKAVSTALARSRSEIPEATVWVDVDATALWQLRESARTATSPGPGLLAYIARFVVAGLQQYPELNAQLDTERQEIVAFAQINLGLAVQTDRGLIVPAVVGADALTTAQLDVEIRRVTARARDGRATVEELSCGTFTLNNYGTFRVDGSAAIINHPQVAILGVGRIIDRPWVVDGAVRVRKIAQLSFVFDHRVCDGATAAGFMRTVADSIENPFSVIARL